ncbi:MAG: prephenate dehydrogenase [Spirochaetaceae bacterium]|jgi:prephenate dehydrogenase|nr:prephenate dehydrogenase [Spirochaetaceae bacterium]
MKALETYTVGFAGLGLMGGAIALALRSQGIIREEGRILAYDHYPDTLALALAEGAIDRGFDAPEAMLSQCDLVFLCLNPTTLLRFMENQMASFRRGTLITDIAGIKGSIAAAMERSLRPDLDFIPGHPMAGSELGGFIHARRCSFQGKNYILTPLARNKPENLALLKTLIYRMGFGRITETSPKEHDRKIAFTSQLCHVIAAALIDCEVDPEITRFGGGSFEDLTRIAMINAPMWTELFLENREELLGRIEQFERSLDTLKGYIARDEGCVLQQCLQTVRERRTAMR